MDKKSLNLEGPSFDISAELEYRVSQRITLHLRWSEFVTGSHAVVASKESEDPNELRDVKILLSGLPVEISVLAKAPSRRK